MLVRRDKHGLYIRNRGGKNYAPYRPGTFKDSSHVWNTGEAGLKEGDKPKTRHVTGEPFVKIWLPNGSFAYWGCYGREEGEYKEND